MRTTGVGLPSQRMTPPPPSAVLAVKALATNSTCAVLTRRAAPPSPDALFLSNRAPRIVTDACDVTAMAPPESEAVFEVKTAD